MPHNKIKGGRRTPVWPLAAGLLNNGRVVMWFTARSGTDVHVIYISGYAQGLPEA
jgi:hypothetical protein